MNGWKLYINNKLAELPDDWSFEAELGSLDLLNPELRVGSIVKDFVLPFNDANRIALNFSENVGAWYKITKSIRYDARLDVQGNTIAGTFILNSITDGYNCQLLIDNGDWLQLLNGINLNDLDFTALNHIFSYANQIASEAGTLDYVYDFIDRGFGVENYQPNGVNTLSYPSKSIQNRLPALKLRVLLKKIFNAIGWDVTGNFIDNADFIKCCLPLNTSYPKISETMRVSGCAYSAPNWPDINWSGSDWPTGYDHCLPVGAWLIPLLPSGANVVWGSKIILSVPYSGEESQIIDSFYGIIGINLVLENINPYVAFNIIIGIKVTTSTETRLYQSEQTIQPLIIQNVAIQTDYLFFKNATTIAFYYDYVNNSSLPQFRYYEAGSYVNIQQTNKLTEGGIFDWSVNLDNTPVIDLLKKFKEQFNLVFWSNNFSRKVLIEPFDDFILDTSQAIDWSSKIDMNVNPEIDFIDLPKKLLFKGKTDDSDGFLKQYSENYHTEFTEVLEVLDNEFSDETKEICSNAFTPTVLKEFVTNDYYPDIESQIAGGIIEGRFEHRCFSYEGLTNFTHVTNIIYDAYNLDLYGVPQSFVLRTDYPKFRSVYFADTNFDGTSVEGCYSKYWSNWINLYKAGELRRFQVQLNQSEINQFSPRKLIWLKLPNYGSGYYVVNRLTTTLNERDSCILELIPYLGKQRLVPLVTSILGENSFSPFAPKQLEMVMGDNGSILIKTNGQTKLKVYPDGKIDTIGTQLYTTDINGNIVPVYFTDLSGNITPMLI